MRRTPLRRKTPISAAASWRKVKSRRDAEVEEEQVRAIVRQRSRGACERCRDAPGSQFHHRKRRSQGGPWSVENIVHLCVYCHQAVHADPAASFTQGWLVRRSDDPALVPIQRA